MNFMQSIKINLFFTLIVSVSCIMQGSFLGNDANASTREQRPDPELRAALVNAVNSSDSFTDRFHAEVWLMDMSKRLAKRVPETASRLELLKSIHYEATRAKLPPEMVLAVIEVESNFNQWAISVVGAQGLMQIMPFWLNEIGRDGDNLFSVKTNLRFGCTILKHYLKKEKGNWTRALARYNGSLGRFKYPNKVFKKLSKNWFRR
jgi:soluble lytic murein transglycosylase-like protein